MTDFHKPGQVVSRRSVLRAGVGGALGLALATTTGVGRGSAAATAAPISWPIVVNGLPTTMDFYGRLNVPSTSSVSGGLICRMFGDPVLMFRQSFPSYSRFDFLRICDAKLNTFQLYFTWGNSDYGGWMRHYVYNPTTRTYTESNGNNWMMTPVNGPVPWDLPADTQPISTYGMFDFALQLQNPTSTEIGYLRETHTSDDAHGRAFWGKVFDESMFGYTQPTMQEVSRKVGRDGTYEVTERADYSFIRPLDGFVNKFQVYRGDSALGHGQTRVTTYNRDGSIRQVRYTKASADDWYTCVEFDDPMGTQNNLFRYRGEPLLWTP